jgi:hypothetical protein
VARAQILTGARAKLLINGKVIGLFTNCSWSVRQDKAPQFILGRFSPAEITPLAQEAVSLDLAGFRVVDAGPYQVANVTQLKNLLEEEDFGVAVLDRQTGRTIFSATGCRATGWSSGVSARSISDVRISILGLVADDEFTAAQGGDGESANASKLDDGA